MSNTQISVIADQLKELEKSINGKDLLIEAYLAEIVRLHEKVDALEAENEKLQAELGAPSNTAKPAPKMLLGTRELAARVTAN